MPVLEPQPSQPQETSVSTVTSHLVAQQGTHHNSFVNIACGRGTSVPFTAHIKNWNIEYIDLGKLLHLDPVAET